MASENQGEYLIRDFENFEEVQIKSKENNKIISQRVTAAVYAVIAVMKIKGSQRLTTSTNGENI